ncbi:NADP-dependent oxidoreductase [Mycobacteroides abscessus]|uniref:NADP-dependent oxidoreductase n=1 Tax=Mycobacteroides abscessus TaxID=36809 RepID=UPI00140408CA|nr:NADP-dependent oxidoreductase [Mycobacteroides abscessus]
MRAIGFYDFGKPEYVLQVVEVAEPHAGPLQVRIRTVAADIKISETFLPTGEFLDFLGPEFPGPDHPVVAGWDLAGIVDEVGSGAEARFAVGDSVIASINGNTGRGAQAEYVVADIVSVVAAPAGITFVEAGSFLTNAITARAMIDALRLSPGETLAVSGGAGTVGGFVIELAKADGYRVVADAKDGDHEFIQRAGADVVVPRSDDFAREILKANGHVDGLIDAANIGDTLLAAVDEGRTAVSARMQTGEGERGVHWIPVFVGDYNTRTDMLEVLRDQAQSGLLTLRVADIYLPQQAREAYRRLQSGGFRGRLVFAF